MLQKTTAKAFKSPEVVSAWVRGIDHEIVEWWKQRPDDNIVISFFAGRCMDAFLDKTTIPPERLIQYTDNDRTEILQQFGKEQSGKILLGKNIARGLDLKHDRARFLIVAKLPKLWPYMPGQRILASHEALLPGFATMTAAQDFAQLAGRHVPNLSLIHI